MLEAAKVAILLLHKSAGLGESIVAVAALIGEHGEVMV